MPLISRSDAARILGVTPQAVYAAVKAGRLSTRTNKYGKVCVNSETMHEEWAATTQLRINQVRKGRPPLRPATERMNTNVDSSATTTSSSATDGVPPYEDSRARTEFLKAELLELERQHKVGTLILAADAEAAWIKLITQARTKLLGVHSKVKQQLPELGIDVLDVIEAAVREALEDLSAPTD